MCFSFDRRWLWMPAAFLNRPVRGARKRRYLLAGALAGALVALVARGWMRTVSDDPVFTVPGTTFVVLAFSAMGACAALALAWRQFGSQRRLLVQRLVAFAPFLLMGPFMPLFVPGLGAAVLLGRRQWRRWARIALAIACTLVALLIAAVMLGRGPLSLLLYAGFAYALFLTNRIAIEPRLHRAAPSPEAWLAVV